MVIYKNARRCDGMVDIADLKSAWSDPVPVRVRSAAPRRRGRHIVRGDFFQKSLLTHFVAAPLQIEPAALGRDLVLGANLETGASIVLR